MPKITYTDEVVVNFGVPYEEFVGGKVNPLAANPIPAEEAQKLSRKDLRIANLWKRNRDQLQSVDPTQYGWTFERWRAIMDEWDQYAVHTIYGGNRCIAAEQEIYDPVAKTSRRIDSIKEPFHVYAWDGEKRVVAKASMPFRKTKKQQIYAVTLASGDTFRASGAHRVLASNGDWLSVSQFEPGVELCHPRSNLGNVQPSQTQGALRWRKTVEGFQSGCRLLLRSCDELLRWASGGDPDAFPLLDGVPTHTSVFGSMHPRLSQPDVCSVQHKSNGPVDKPLYSHSWFLDTLLATQGVQAQSEGQFSDILCHAFCSTYRSACRLIRAVGQSKPVSFLLRSSQRFAALGNQLRYVFPFCYRYNVVKRCESNTTTSIVANVKLLREDWVWDIEVPSYHNYIIGDTVHHNSSKSTFCARLCVFMAQVIPEAEIRCWSVNEQSSINDQQRMIWEALPEKYKNMPKAKGDNFSVQYSQKNGFSGRKLILPPLNGKGKGSIIHFQNYRSYQLDPQVAEGWKAHIVWLDEECPQALFETMIFRVADYRGRILLSFTTLKGWTSLIHDINAGAETIEKRYSELLDESVPYEQLSKNRSRCKIWYFWTEDNPYIPPDMLADLKTRPREEQLARAHGVCVKSSTTKFPKFNRRIHVIPHEDLPWINKRNMVVTRYQTLDPAGKKPWVWLYAGVTQSLDEDMPNIYIWDEFPDRSYGNWGVTDETPKGKPGDAMKSLGWGIRQYIAKMMDMEGGMDIFERGIDKRFANHTHTGRDGDTRLLEELLQEGVRYVTPVTKRVDMRNEIELGIQAVNDYLDYDETRDMDSLNMPHMFISDRCENLIECMENFTGEGGTEEVWKDYIDCLRILLEINPRCIDMSQFKTGQAAVRGY